VSRVVIDGRALSIPVRALGARLALVERPSGKLVASSPGEPIARGH
jgi:hypothetical protein